MSKLTDLEDRVEIVEDSVNDYTAKFIIVRIISIIVMYFLLTHFLVLKSEFEIAADEWALGRKVPHCVPNGACLMAESQTETTIPLDEKSTCISECKNIMRESYPDPSRILNISLKHHKTGRWINHTSGTPDTICEKACGRMYPSFRIIKGYRSFSDPNECIALGGDVLGWRCEDDELLGIFEITNHSCCKRETTTIDPLLECYDECNSSSTPGRSMIKCLDWCNEHIGETTTTIHTKDKIRYFDENGILHFGYEKATTTIPETFSSWGVGQPLSNLIELCLSMSGLPLVGVDETLGYEAALTCGIGGSEDVILTKESWERNELEQNLEVSFGGKS